jgi:multiple sugar transport system permease protein
LSRRAARRWTWRVAALAATLLFVAPLVLLVLGALRPPGVPPPRGADVFLPDPSLAALERAFELVPLGDQMINSVIVAAIAVPVTVIVSSMAGFGIVLLGPRGRRIAIGACLVLFMVPLSALWVPRFVIYRELGWIDTYAPLVAPAFMGTSTFYVLLFYWSFRGIPRDLVDAARLEGLGPLRTWATVALPLAQPTVFAVGALAFVFHWGNFMDALLYLQSAEKATLPLGLTALGQLGPHDLPVLLAGALVATVPSLLAFAAVQRRFLTTTRGAGWLGY